MVALKTDVRMGPVVPGSARRTSTSHRRDLMFAVYGSVITSLRSAMPIYRRRITQLVTETTMYPRRWPGSVVGDGYSVVSVR